MPPLLLSSHVVGIKTTVLEYRCCILGGGNGESRCGTDAGGCDRGGHGWRILFPSLLGIRGLYLSYFSKADLGFSKVLQQIVVSPPMEEWMVRWSVKGRGGVRAVT